MLNPEPELKKSKTFLTSNGYEVIVDEEDYEKVVCNNWVAQLKKDKTSVKCVYRITSIRGKVLRIGIAQRIIGRRSGLVIDHRDRNPLNNRKSNLRYASHSQNAMNRSKSKNTSSKYKGVYWAGNHGRWRALIRFKVDGKNKQIVRQFKSEHEAAIAYNNMAKKLFGEFAVLNIIEEQDYSFLFPVC